MNKQEMKQMAAEVPHRIDEKMYGRNIKQHELEEKNLSILEKVFGIKRKANPDLPRIDEMKEKYSEKEVIDFFDGLITQEKNGYEINKEILEQLRESGRMIPVYGKKYSRYQLISYFLETEPRPS